MNRVEDAEEDAAQGSGIICLDVVTANNVSCLQKAGRRIP